MKKILLASLSLFFLLAPLLTMPVRASAENSLFVNSGFETGDLTGWDVQAGDFGVAVDGTPMQTDLGPSSVEVRSGTYAAYNLTASSSSHATVSQTIDVQPNTLYNFGYYFVNAAHNTGIYDEIQVNGVQIPTNEFNNGPPWIGTDPSDFKKRVGSYFTQSNETSVTVSFKLSGSSLATTLFSYDDFFAYVDTTAPTWPQNALVDYAIEDADNPADSLLSLDWSRPLNDGVIASTKIYGDGELLITSNTVDAWSNGGGPSISYNVGPVPNARTYKIEVCDGAGRCTTDGPSVTIGPFNLRTTSPTKNAPALAWDAAQGAISYNIYRNGVLVGSSATNSFTDVALPEGIYTYYMTTVDSAGESAPSGTIKTAVDKTRPTLTFTSPASFAQAFSQGPLVTIHAVDTNGYGLNNMAIHVYTSANVLLNTCGGISVGQKERSMSCDLSSLPNGTYYIKAGAFDRAGNNRTIHSGNFVISN